MSQTKTELLATLPQTRAHVAKRRELVQSRADYIATLEQKQKAATDAADARAAEGIGRELEEERECLRLLERELADSVNVADAFLRSTADTLGQLYAPEFARKPTSKETLELRFERVRNLGTDARALEARFEECIALLEQAPEAEPTPAAN